MDHSLALDEHAMNNKHHIITEDSQVIAKIDHFHHPKFREAIEIMKMYKTLNRDDGWKVIHCSIPSLFFYLFSFFFTLFVFLFFSSPFF